MLFPIVEHTSVSGGYWGGGGGRDLTWQPAAKHQSAAATAINNGSCDRTAAQVKKRIPEQRTASTQPISKKRHQSCYQTLLEIEKEIVEKLLEVTKTT